MNREEFESYVKTVIPENSVVIVQVPSDRLSEVSISLHDLSRNLLHMKVIFLACPIEFNVSVCPAGADVKVSE